MRCPIEWPTCHRETEKDCPTKDETGSPICTLGVSSIPARTGEGYTVYELTPMDNSDIKVRLSATHRAYIRFLVERGGAVDFDEGGNISGEALAHVNLMVYEMKIIDRTPIIGSTRVRHKLTAFGNRVATAIMKQGA